MAILRNPNRGKFTVVDNYALRDDNLSLKARGLLVTMLSLPDNWQFSENGLCAIFQKDGQASIRSGLKELEEGGYLIRKRTRDGFGRVSNVEWTICDYPHLENPSVVNPNLDFRPQLNTKQSNTEIIKELNNIPPLPPTGELFGRFWAAYPKKVGKANCERWFARHKVNEETLQAMLDSLAYLTTTEQWQKDGGQYIPNPQTWLNGRRWEDESAKPPQREKVTYIGKL